MARLHHEAMEELAGTLAGLSDICGAFEFHDNAGGEYVAQTIMDTGNFEVRLAVFTDEDAIERSE